MLHLDELDRLTRDVMLRAFVEEQESPDPYVPRGMSTLGQDSFPTFVRAAITTGNEDGLGAALQIPAFWRRDDGRDRWDELAAGVTEVAYLLGINEFNTWYVRGLAMRLADEGEDVCEVYRAARHPCLGDDCAAWEGDIVILNDVLKGHRARYWPEPGDPAAFSVPLGPGCYHSIRRARLPSAPGDETLRRR